jgi:predicted O-methyltransferase YrrM
MADDIYEEVDAYIEKLFVPADPALNAALQATARRGLPEIQVSPAQGKLLYLLARLMRAERILELGTLAGYSAIWLARALPPGGRLVTLEYSQKHADVARENLAAAGLADRVELIVGPALASLADLAARSSPPFDMIFIDADKENYSAYLDGSLKLARPGTLILADNVIRDGAVARKGGDAMARAARAFNERLAGHPKLESVILQQVGTKGHDGLAMAVVK